MSYFVSFCSCVFSVLLAWRLPRLGKREQILVLFVRLFDLCLFGFVVPLPLGVWEGLRFVIVALPGLFSYLFCFWTAGKQLEKHKFKSFSLQKWQNIFLTPWCCSLFNFSFLAVLYLRYMYLSIGISSRVIQGKPINLAQCYYPGNCGR